MIIFSKVSFSYDGQRDVLKSLSFFIKRGEKVAIIGPNGAGKSTLINLLNGIRKAHGKIIIEGTEITKESLMKIKSSVGVVFQSPEEQLFCPTVFDDVAFGPLNQGKAKDEIEEIVKLALDNVGLEGKESCLINELSFGEKKLVSLATVLSMNPNILAFDEPSSNLDPYHRRLLINWIKKAVDKTVVIATHDLDFVLDTCSKVILISDGELIKEDLTENILTDKDLLLKYNMELPLSKQ